MHPMSAAHVLNFEIKYLNTFTFHVISSIYVHMSNFGDFAISRFSENGLKYGPKTSKNHENSNFDKSADMADINVLQVRECDYRLIKDIF